MVADTRDCEQCGASFVPRREHARFCCVRCRAGWDREHRGDSAAGASALVWSLVAMSETTGRLARVRAWDRRWALAAIGDAVWAVTIVDATLVRHHLAAYDAVMAGQTPARRELVDGTLAGLRFVRNRIGGDADLAEFIRPGENAQNVDQARITSWTWKPAPESALTLLPSRGRAWELTRYRAYEAHLAGHTTGEVFGLVTAFLELTAAKATPITAGTAKPG